MTPCMARAPWVVIGLLALAACTPVGPDFQRPEAPVREDWHSPDADDLAGTAGDLTAWWTVFQDPVLDELVARALAGSNTLELAGLRILEARAQLGIATGLQYPQAQAAAGSVGYVAPPASSLLLRNGWQYSLSASLAWELDFWGRFRRGIEAADAAYLASEAGWQQAQVLLTAGVVDLYLVLRITEEQLRIARDNAGLQRRSLGITTVLFEKGADSELDLQQAKTQLLATEATIPELEVAVVQARNALSTLLGEPPGAVEALLARGAGIPRVPVGLAAGVPADLLRQRPDVRQAELLAAAQSAQVGLAEADLYPSFSLTGAIGLSAGVPGGDSLGEFFDADSLNRTGGASFVWPFLNYGRIRNNVRVQDARLQQALVAYAETVIQAAREVEDAIAAYAGAKRQLELLSASVAAARRSYELSSVRYSEGYADFERVLRAQQSLFAQEQRRAATRGDLARSVVSLYRALGGGWNAGRAVVDEATRETMRERTNWGDVIDGR